MWQLGLPVRVNNRITDMLIHLYHLWLPLVEVDRLDLRDVNLQLSMLTRASEADECSEGYGGPSRRLGMAICAFSILSRFQ